MPRTFSTVVFPVSDLTAATAFYTAATGVEPYVDSPYYVGFKVGDVEVGLDPNGAKQGQTAPIGYFDVDDMDAAIAELEGAGATVTRPSSDVGGGLLVAVLADADGNPVGLRAFPSGA